MKTMIYLMTHHEVIDFLSRVGQPAEEVPDLSSTRQGDRILPTPAPPVQQLLEHYQKLRRIAQAATNDLQPHKTTKLILDFNLHRMFIKNCTNVECSDQLQPADFINTLAASGKALRVDLIEVTTAAVNQPIPPRYPTTKTTPTI